MATKSMSKRRQKDGDETKVRERILEAAFRAFRKGGYATTSTLEIATRARVSKRELYELVGNKQEMLIASDFFRNEVRPRGKRSRGDCCIPAGDRRGGSSPRSGACAQLYRARGKPRRPAQNHGRGPVVQAAHGPSCRTCRAVRRVALARFAGQPTAWRRRATDPPQNRGTCLRRRSRLPATSSATE